MFAHTWHGEFTHGGVECPQIAQYIAHDMWHEMFAHNNTKCLHMVAHAECSHMVAQNVLLW